MSSNVDLAELLRRRKPERRRTQLAPRPLGALVAAADIAGRGRAILLPDTNVYIRSAAGTLPAAVAMLLDRALLYHCSVCLGELATGVAHADPAHPDWPRLRDHYVGLFRAIQATRIMVPDASTWAEAGTIAGLLARSQRFQRHQRKECLNDALIYLTATRAGLPVLTANRTEFDLIQQLVPEGRFIHF